MHLAILFAILMGSFVAAAPSVQHAQITVEVTNMDAQSQVDALHSSEELVMNNHWRQKSLPFNFTLSARYANGATHATLSFGFRDLNVDGFVKGELGFTTVFGLSGGKLINGNQALGYHPNFITPPWTSLWPLKTEDSPLFDLVAISKSTRGKKNHFLEFANPHDFFGAFEIKREQPIFIGNSQEEHGRFRLLIAIEPVWNSSDDINEEFVEELL